MYTTEEQIDKMQKMTADIVHIINDGAEHSAFNMTLMTYLNANVIFGILGGADPTEILKNLRDHTGMAYKGICAAKTKQ